MICQRNGCFDFFGLLCTNTFPPCSIIIEIYRPFITFVSPKVHHMEKIENSLSLLCFETEATVEFEFELRFTCIHFSHHSGNPKWRYFQKSHNLIQSSSLLSVSLSLLSLSFFFHFIVLSCLNKKQPDKTYSGPHLSCTKRGRGQFENEDALKHFSLSNWRVQGRGGENWTVPAGVKEQ